MLEKIFAAFQAFLSIFSSCPQFEYCDSCGPRNFTIEQVGQLPADIRESSGLAIGSNFFFTTSDNGPEPVVYGVSSPFTGKCEIQGTIALGDTIINNDWEDLTSDPHSNLYIGDFGNNDNLRQDLSIIKFDPISGAVGKILFAYNDQVGFPPRKWKNRNFDCEAFFWTHDSLFLFSKNRTSDEVKVYALPDKPGRHVAETVATIPLGFPVTSADISPDGRMVALLSYGKVFLYTVDWPEHTKPEFTPFACINFRNSGQSEAICFIDDRNWLITNEAGKVFWMRALDELLPPPEHPVFRDVGLLPGQEPPAR